MRAGVRITLLLALSGIAYVAATWGAPHRALIAALLAGAFADGVVISNLPHERLIREGRHDALLTAWNAVHVFVAAIACLLDGGTHSPFVLIFFIAIAYAAVSLPRRSVLGLAAFVLVTLGTVAAIHGEGSPALLVQLPALATLAAVCTEIARERLVRLTALHDAKEEMFVRLATVVEYRDNETGAHTERMSAYSAIVARRLGWSDDDAELLRVAAGMHDIGKVAVPDAILLKLGALTPEERAVMQRHTTVGHEMLSGSRSDQLQLAATIALTHHERPDGAGYPHGLAGDEIPVPGRIVAVADVFDALTSDRVYRAALPVEKALAILREGRGTQFDPDVLDAFEASLDDVLAVRARTLPGAGPVALAA